MTKKIASGGDQIPKPTIFVVAELKLATSDCQASSESFKNYKIQFSQGSNKQYSIVL